MEDIRMVMGSPSWPPMPPAYAAAAPAVVLACLLAYSPAALATLRVALLLAAAALALLLGLSVRRRPHRWPPRTFHRIPPLK
jgi:hypothetical protein